MSELPVKTNRRRPRLQFSLLGMLVTMFVVAAATAPGYYMMRAGRDELPQSRLIGILMILAGPLLLMTFVSVLLAMGRRGGPE